MIEAQEVLPATWLTHIQNQVFDGFTMAANHWSMVALVFHLPLVPMVLRWFLVWQPLHPMVFQWFSNDGMATIHPYGVTCKIEVQIEC